MARIVIEDAVFYLISFYLLSNILFSGFGLLESYTPGYRYDNNCACLVPYTTSHSSIFGSEASDINATLQKYSNTSSIDAGALINPVALLGLVWVYINLIIDIISSTMLFYVLKLFMGEQLAHVITFILNIMFVVVCIRILSGRLRWD